MKILAVDDDIHMLTTLQIVLAAGGYQAATLTDCKDAAFLLAKPNSEYKLLLLDINMPGMSGMDLLTFIDKLNSDIKIIVITGDSECEFNRDIRGRKNVAGFLLKPFNVDYLLNVIKDVEDSVSAQVG